LVRGVAFRHIALHHHLSTTALQRHKKSHLPQKLALVERHQQTLSAERLLEQMADLMARLWRGLDASEKANSPAALVAFAREVRQCLESYSGISNASRLIQGGTSEGTLAERVATGRRRLAEARSQLTEDESQSQDDASLKSLGPQSV
jgi:hypothetical protein